MEAYPREYVEHNLPLVLLSGLGESVDGEHSAPKPTRQEYGTKILTASPECQGERAARLLEELFRHDGSSQPWNLASMPGSSGILRYRMRPIGRVWNVAFIRMLLLQICSHLLDTHIACEEGCPSTTVSECRRLFRRALWSVTR